MELRYPTSVDFFLVVHVAMTHAVWQSRLIEHG